MQRFTEKEHRRHAVEWLSSSFTRGLAEGSKADAEYYLNHATLKGEKTLLGDYHRLLMEEPKVFILHVEDESAEFVNAIKEILLILERENPENQGTAICAIRWHNDVRKASVALLMSEDYMRNMSQELQKPFLYFPDRDAVSLRQ